MTRTVPAVLVIGAGMYVAGRGADTDGTVLPTLIQAQSDGIVGEIHIAATSKSSIDLVNSKLTELNLRLETNVKINGWPSDNLYNPNAYLDAIKELPQPAACIVVTPDHLHHEITSQVIRSGVHPLVVKPFTPTLEEALDLIRLADQENVYGAVEFHKRFDETNLLLRQSINDNNLGDVRYITVEYSQRRMMRSVFESWVDKTNIFQYLGVHYVDLISFLTQATPTRVAALGQPVSGLSAGSDSIQVMTEWQPKNSSDRFVSTIVTNWIDPDSTSAMSDQKITVVGTKGRYQVDQKNRGAQRVTQTGGIEEVNPYFSQIYTGGDGRPAVHGYGPRCIIQFLKDVTDVSNGEVEIDQLISERPTFRDALPSTAVIEAVNQSLSDHGNWVDVPRYLF